MNSGDLMGKKWKIEGIKLTGIDTTKSAKDWWKPALAQKNQSKIMRDNIKSNVGKYKDYSMLTASYSKSLIVPVSDEKLIPTLNSFRLSAA